MTDKLDALVPDIYAMLMDKGLTPKEVAVVARSFGEECENILNEVMKEKDRGGRLRLSAIGKPDRKQWLDYHQHGTGEPIDGPTYIKFLYGHLIEAMVVALARLAGHSVTEQQKEVEVSGVKGHIDGYVDGVLADIKSASSYGFKKFKYNELHQNDQFHYIPQLMSYAHAEGQDEIAWVAMDKASGELTVLRYDLLDQGASYSEAVAAFDPSFQVSTIKDVIASDHMPERCYEDVPDGESGNRKLDSGCHWCEYKKVCWPDLRTFQYANGPKYLTHVNRTPRVIEVHPDF